ncbi:TPA: hypothetical protein ACNTVM_004757, partial [Escherichia coli]
KRPILLAVDCTELALLASKVTSLPEGSPIQPTIVEVCVYADTKKRRERRLYRLRLKREANPGTRFNEVPDKHKPKMPQGARGQVQCNIGS